MSYRFLGEVIKLTDKDYQKIERLFPSLNLELELTMLDMAFAGEGTTKYWMPMMAKLRYQAEKPKKSSTRDTPLSQDLNDTSWASNVRRIGADK